MKSTNTAWPAKKVQLYVVLFAIFLTNALIAEFIGVKVFSLEGVLGMQAVDVTLFGVEGLGFNLTAGVLLWPVVFVMTDIVNEYFGRRGVRSMSFATVGMILFAFLVVRASMSLPPADFWPTSHLMKYTPSEAAQVASGVAHLDMAYKEIFGQGMWIVIGSLAAFLVGQFVDVFAFHRIKSWSGEQKLWLRATGSTLVSQLVDSFIVLFIAFYIGGDWPLLQVLAICLMNYVYKFVVAIILTPVIYMAHHWIDQYLGDALADRLKTEAMRST